MFYLKEEFDSLHSRTNTLLAHMSVCRQSARAGRKRLEYEAREKESEKAHINKLNAFLIKDKRFEDLGRSASDDDFQKQLMLDYGIR